MPVMKNRPTKGAGKSTQRKPTEARPSNGVQKLDGRKNTNAGSTHSAKPWDLEGKSVVIKTPV